MLLPVGRAGGPTSRRASGIGLIPWHGRAQRIQPVDTPNRPPIDRQLPNAPGNDSPRGSATQPIRAIADARTVRPRTKPAGLRVTSTHLWFERKGSVCPIRQHIPAAITGIPIFQQQVLDEVFSAAKQYPGRETSESFAPCAGQRKIEETRPLTPACATLATFANLGRLHGDAEDKHSRFRVGPDGRVATHVRNYLAHPQRRYDTPLAGMRTWEPPQTPKIDRTRTVHCASSSSELCPQ